MAKIVSDKGTASASSGTAKVTTAYILKRPSTETVDSCDIDGEADLSIKSMFVMAVATSIDALAVGISLAMAGNVNIWIAVALIGIITFILSAVGVKVGHMFGSRFEKKAQFCGGIILILLGFKILLEHLGVLA